MYNYKLVRVKGYDLQQPGNLFNFRGLKEDEDQVSCLYGNTFYSLVYSHFKMKRDKR